MLYVDKMKKENELSIENDEDSTYKYTKVKFGEGCTLPNTCSINDERKNFLSQNEEFHSKLYSNNIENEEEELSDYFNMFNNVDETYNNSPHCQKDLSLIESIQALTDITSGNDRLYSIIPDNISESDVQIIKDEENEILENLDDNEVMKELLINDIQSDVEENNLVENHLNNMENISVNYNLHDNLNMMRNVNNDININIHNNVDNN
ncbi:hypothetical protein PFAG_03066 [Plasmodium falciparum Santa Lucia]|nr:hypothetical protein PFBG_03143 [Plasmodium falciparum 7G8]EUT85374.1 hypothetical protein PFAG_03066 [Plasmodium falciparum Santa Lucia]